MCGIAGYIGGNMSRLYVMKGLARLEYRGYDSTGFACLTRNNDLLYKKAKGSLQCLEELFEAQPIDGHIGIGHTRWSTHGIASFENAHPQIDCHNNIAVMHNGIIENHALLKKELMQQGHRFNSQTDTEVITHLLEDVIDSGKSDLIFACKQLVNRLHGAYAFTAILTQYPDTLLAVRKGSPLCIGLSRDEMFLASDPFAFAGFTDHVIFLPDQSFALLKKDSVAIFDFEGNPLTVTSQRVAISYVDEEKKGYEHYMLKEIYEQKAVLYATISQLQALSSEELWQQMGINATAVQQFNSVHMIACGSSWYAARIAQFYFEQVVGISARVLLASEFRYMPFFPESNSLYMTVSQSGETADTLEALRMLGKYNLPTVTLTNVASSTMVREAKGFLLTQAGQEIAVASTKAFSTQVAALFWLAHRIALEKRLITPQLFEQGINDLLVAAEVLEQSIERYKTNIIEDIVPTYSAYKRWIFLGRHISYPFAMEAALKLKEISYLFAQCYPAGELKHGPIALIDQETPVVLFSTLDPLIYQKLVSNAQEVKARQGKLLVFAFDGQDELLDLADDTFLIEKVNPLLAPLAMTGLMQFFAYSIAKALQRPIDKPRNLAKSVTVE